MPELPEVEAVCRKLRAGVIGSTIRSVIVHRCASESVARHAPGRKITAVDRRAKHILVRLSGGYTLHVHLRMTGKLFTIPDWRMHSANARVIFELSGKAGMVYEDPRALGKLEIVETVAIDLAMAKLGPEPLGDAFSLESFIEIARASKLPAKLFLLDQRKVAGLGNMYAAEALYRAGIDPRKPLTRLTRPRLARLHQEIVQILEHAIQSTSRAYAGPGVISEAEEFPWSVYGREGEPCNTCGAPIRRIAQGGRSTYFCARCQR